MTRAVLSIGANLGDRLAALQSAVDLLHAYADLDVVAVSPVYETAPVGPPQPDYLNAVVLLDVAGSPADLLARAQAVEDALGRVRAERWGPRAIDVDVVAVGGTTSADPALTLPHPRAAERAFVLAPWADVDPEATLPGLGRVTDLLARVGRGGVRRRDDLLLRLPAERDA